MDIGAKIHIRHLILIKTNYIVAALVYSDLNDCQYLKSLSEIDLVQTGKK